MPLVAVVATYSDNQERRPSIQSLVDLVSGGMADVNELILSKAGSNVELIPEIAKHLISSGGKRLRRVKADLAVGSRGDQGHGGGDHDGIAVQVHGGSSIPVQAIGKGLVEPHLQFLPIDVGLASGRQTLR